MRLPGFLFAAPAQQLPIKASALELGGRAKADGPKNLLAPVAEQEFQSQDINAFEDAMKSGLARSRGVLETESKQPVVRIVASPISNGRLTSAAAHHSYAGKQKDR